MDNITPEQIQERYNKLSPELQKALTSDDVHNAIRRIGRDKGLMLDQVGDLADQVGLVILGFAKASNFVNDITKRLSVPDDKAREITTLINNEVLNEIRRDIEANTATVEKQAEKSEVAKSVEDHISAIEKEGGFEIERQPEASAIPANLPGAERVETRADIMAGIENPEPVQMRPAGDAVPQPFRQSPPPAAPQEPKSEPLIDQLLKGATAIPEQKIVKPAQETPPKPVPPKPSAGDPYREPLE